MSLVPMQRRYWNRLASEYHRITRITLDDFHYGPQIPGEQTLGLLPPLHPGQTALELGCGGAENSVWLARQGLRCTALDLSTAQLRKARSIAKKAGVQIRFVQTALETYPQRIRGRYDLIHSSHALEFVDDPGEVLRYAARQLKPGGSLVLSTVHPLYNGDWIDGTYEEDQGEQKDGQGLFLTSYFTPPDDVRDDAQGEVVSRAYPVSTWFNWLRKAGLEVVHLAEPAALPNGQTPPYTSDDWAIDDGELHAIPGTVIFVARKPGAAPTHPTRRRATPRPKGSHATRP